jgi:hypothetical protein
MVTEFETLETLNEINDAFDNGDMTTVKDKLMTLKDKYQTMCDEFDKWCDEQARIDAEIDAGRLELEEAGLEKYGTNQ